MVKTISSTLGLLVCGMFTLYLSSTQHVAACRVGSEKLKSYTRKSIERLLDTQILESVYWPEEPLNAGTLSKATGVNISLAETHFEQFNIDKPVKRDAENTNDKPVFIRDIFVTCSADRDRIYTLTINLELTNPFRLIDMRFESQKPSEHQNSTSSLETGKFRIYLPKSTFLVQLSQRISYDECLEVNYVQLTPNVAYGLNCFGCNERQQDFLDKVLSKRKTQLNAELDSILSEKLLLGLQTLLNQQRLDLDLYLR